MMRDDARADEMREDARAGEMRDGARADDRVPVDVLIVSLGSTGGWRAADAELASSLERAGVRVALARAPLPAPVRTFMLTDLRWARAARVAAAHALSTYRPRATIYSTTTAALLWPAAGAIRFDALAAANRPGRHGLWQRPLERRRLRESSLLLPMSEGALREREGASRRAGRSLVLPMPVEPSGPAHGERDIAALTYAANPAKKGTKRVLDAWLTVRRPSEQLVVAGCSRADLARARIELSEHQQGLCCVGVLPQADYRALVRRARVFVSASSREDYGIAQLEALVDGCLLVTTAAPGPYPALALARDLDPRLVGEQLELTLRTALDQPAADYRTRALRALAPFRRDAVDRLVAEELVPRLLGSAPACAAC
jgi:glycosyltransferase involved in cell wall biosynthesis